MKRRNMCNYQKLAKGNHGYVIRCMQCQSYQVVFKNIILSLSSKEFGKLLFELRNTRNQQHHSGSGPGILLAAGKPGVHLYMKEGEIREMEAMIELADSELKALELLAHFQGVI